MRIYSTWIPQTYMCLNTKQGPAFFFFFFLVWYGKNKKKETKPGKIAVTFLGKKPGCEKDFNYGGGIQTCIYLVSTKKILFLIKK